MIPALLSEDQLRRRLAGGGIQLRIGPFVVRLESDLPELPGLLRNLYGLYPLSEERRFADFHVRLRRSRLVRRWWRTQVEFLMDGESPFLPFPRDTALPFLEWGLNWGIATRANQYLMLHAGVVEKGGRAVVLPAWPGSGKSTLCAALCHRGWRLLSDEFALLRPADGALIPLPRLIALKNDSIAVIRRFAPDAVLGPEYPKTRKGTVAHLRPPRESIERADEAARAAWVIFPNYERGAKLRLLPLPKERAFLKLSGNSFNYEFIGLRGFEAASALIDACDCHLFRYDDLDQAVACLDALAAG